MKTSPETQPFKNHPLMCEHNQRVIDKRLRSPKTPMPENIKVFYDRLMDKMERIARKEFKETGLFYFVRGGIYPGTSDTDEHASGTVYNTLRYRYKLEELPNYSPENFEKTTKFWQSWQNPETGIFIDPKTDDPKKPKDIEALKIKYALGQKSMVGLFSQLGIEPLYTPFSMVDEEEINFKELWQMVEVQDSHHYAASHSGKMIELINLRYDSGEKEFHHLLENYMSVLAGKLLPVSGLVQEDEFHDYPHSENTLKLIGRIIGYMGLENLPYMMKMADTIIKFSDEMRWGGSPGNLRNMSELLSHCYYYHDYRRDDICRALEILSQAVDPDNNIYQQSWGYTMGLVKHAGFILNWENMDHGNSGYRWGLPFRHRFFVCPYGHWVNIQQKMPHEVIDHPDYDYENTGMEIATAEMRRKVIHNKCRAIEADEWHYTDSPKYPEGFHHTLSPEGLNFGRPDFAGMRKVYLKQATNLTGTGDYKMPFIKAKFKGCFDLYLNGVLITRVLPENIVKEWGWCGFFIDKEKQHALRDGLNFITVEFTDWSPDSTISVGVIDWD
jgi:hypothetical protein